MEKNLEKRILSSIILIPVVFFLIIYGSYPFILLLIIIFFISIFEWHKMTKNKPYYIFGFIFLILSFYSIYKIRMIENNSYESLLVILLICIFTDSGGYIFGKLFKGPKLISYSPNKTITGMFGSYLFPLCIIPLLIHFNLIKEYQNIFFIIYIFLISTVSQIGDIVISIFKRKSKIKDTGKIIPGHGGILDRIDGMLFAFPFAYLIMLTNLFERI